MSAYYLTTPIYYVNDVPHVGHAYTTIAADALTRARRLRGLDAFFLTGTDEHGQNIERIAREKGLPTQDYCDLIAERFKALWKRLDIEYDDFIRTTDAVHKRGVLKLWGALRDAKGPDDRDVVYKGKYAGWYCPRCEAFKTEDELKQPGNVCPDHERPCEWTEEENWFFRLSAYQGWLQQMIGGEKPLLRIDPAGRRNEVLSVIRQGLQDFSISRARVKWGIPVPDEPGHVFYVWMDALANYITALGFGEEGPEKRKRYLQYWEGEGERFHLVGKEIIRFHCLYWPAMLKAAGLPVPNRIFAHGFLTKNGRKLSKSTGNVIDPEALVTEYGPDAVRYFLLREGSFGQDWDFTDQAFVGRYNADLANDLGNLVSRALTMVERYCGGKVPPQPPHAVKPPAGMQVGPVQQLAPEEVLQATAGYEDGRLITGSEYEARRVLDLYERLDFAGALSYVWRWVALFNQRIVDFAPWERAKEPARRADLEAFLFRLLEGIRAVALWASPVIPDATERVLTMLALPRSAGPRDLEWLRLEPGAALGPIEPLFPRIEKDKEKTVSETRPPASDEPAKQRAASEAGFTPAERAGVPGGATEHPLAQPKIDIADFARVELRVAEIKEAEKVAGSKKLIRLQVDLGSERRQVVAGIAESYAPEALVGKRVVLVTNLKPARLMGVESDGMVLAASADGRAVLCTLDADVAPGTKVK